MRFLIDSLAAQGGVVRDRLGGVLETLIAAAKARELDLLLETATGIERDPRVKKPTMKAA